MADPLSSVGAILGLLSFGLRATASLAQISNSIYLTSPTRRALRKSIGKYAYFVVKLVLADTIDQLERIDQSVLPGSEEVVLAFKNSYISDCTQTAVAGAIVAQIAVTALSLPYLSQTHWIARAFFILSLISGLLSVYFAVLLQRTVGGLYTVTDIKDWLSTRDDYPDVQTIRGLLLDFEQYRELSSKASGLDAVTILSQLRSAQKSFHKITAGVRGSFSSAQMLQTPSYLINISLGLFVTGLAVYLGFLWTRDLDTNAGPNDSRNVFIIFLVFVVFCISSYSTPRGLKDQEVVPVRLFKRLLLSYDTLKRDMKEKINEELNRPPDLDSVFKPISRRKVSGFPEQVVGNIPEVPEDNAITSSSNQTPLHTRHTADDTFFTPRPRDRSAQHVEKESLDVLGANNGGNTITNLTANVSLISALQAAAQAHNASADADRKVAEVYRQIVDSLPGGKNNNKAA